MTLSDRHGAGLHMGDILLQSGFGKMKSRRWSEGLGMGPHQGGRRVGPGQIGSRKGEPHGRTSRRGAQ
jgi:hypothetical protein